MLGFGDEQRSSPAGRQRSFFRPSRYSFNRPTFFPVLKHWAIVKKMRSEEHTSELQSQSNLVCRLLLEKKKATAHVNIDKTAPAVTAMRSPGANANGWNKGTVVGTLAADEELSGGAPGSLPATRTLSID